MEFLKLCDYQVATARDGLAVLAALAIMLPDLVLMDLAMPVLDGWKTTRAIRQPRHLAQLPVIAVTSHVTPAHFRLAREAGGQDCVGKPVEFMVLLDAIERQLRSHLWPAASATLRSLATR